MSQQIFQNILYTAMKKGFVIRSVRFNKINIIYLKYLTENRMIFVNSKSINKFHVNLVINQNNELYNLKANLNIYKNTY